MATTHSYRTPPLPSVSLSIVIRATQLARLQDAVQLTNTFRRKQPQRARLENTGRQSEGKSAHASTTPTNKPTSLAMGLSSGLHDVSGAAPLPLLLLASVASSLASLFSVVSSPGAGANPNTTTPSSVRISGLDALVVLADCLAASYVSTADGATAAAAGDCTVCLSAIAEGERVRTLACRHAFHAACLDGWFDQSSLSCPLCRAGPAARDDDARRRSASEDAVSWFARF
ncbi:hypothetical protein GQ55_4G183800 [Panicum hallii var. hallii]|uniref:RING-type domain-containing protein n=1 Tax=Panicum hallii var. hallii TaxID=1504633 RepID=A0A2T7DYV9_9POAL|nr:hypothetical protein GQ55_4G183800 [Panicum hallii var. hallii]